jgi:hypothetical protein
MSTPPTNWILPRDPDAENEASELARRIWNDGLRESEITYTVINGSVTAEARTTLIHGSRLEILVRGDTSAEAAVRLVRLLRAYGSAQFNKSPP